MPRDKKERFYAEVSYQEEASREDGDTTFRIAVTIFDREVAPGKGVVLDRCFSKKVFQRLFLDTLYSGSLRSSLIEDEVNEVLNMVLERVQKEIRGG
jgi:hypothetical protein